MPASTLYVNASDSRAPTRIPTCGPRKKREPFMFCGAKRALLMTSHVVIRHVVRSRPKGSRSVAALILTIGVRWPDFHSLTVDSLIDRRTFIGTLAGGLVASPFAAFAQQPTKGPRVGVIGGQDGPTWDGLR